MKSRTIAVVIFYTDEHKILLQNRKSIMKWGEEWSFWGGGLDPGETKEDAAIREIKEELDFNVKDLKYLGSLTEIIERYKDPNDKRRITYEIFVSKIEEDPSLFKVKEGDGLAFFTLKETKDLAMVPKIDEKTLVIVEKFLSNL
jgi:mutator protein MutT